MKVVHVMTYAHGGAGIAALRIHRALSATPGVDSSVLCLSAPPAPEREISVFPKHFARFWERGAARFGVDLSRADREASRRKQLEIGTIPFSEPASDYDVASHPLVRDADVVHLHWVGGFLDWGTFFRRIGKPVVWTLHDMNPFLGGFHYESDKSRANAAARDFDAKLAERKAALVDGAVDLHIVCPSTWLLGHSQNSDVLGRFPHSMIRYAIDAEVFRPHDRNSARELFGIAPDARVLLTVAERVGDPRKGADILQAAMSNPAIADRFVWTAIGEPEGIAGLGARALGSIGDPRMMALAYSAADLVVVPSREDNLPNVVLESHSVGTPVVALPTGGIPEMIQDSWNGALAHNVSSEALAEAILRADAMSFDRGAIRDTAMIVYDPGTVAAKYAEVYQRLLAH